MLLKEIRAADRSRTSVFWEEEVPQMDEREFKSNFRINRTTFEAIISATKDQIMDSGNYKRSVTAEKKIAIGLYTLASNAEYRTVGNLFGVSKQTVMRAFKGLVHAITSSDLMNKYLQIPTEEELLKISDGFRERTGYINACGALDGTHVRERAPVDQRTAYFDHHEDHSILTLAICDHRARFWWLKTGIPGRSNDAGAFLESDLYSRFCSGQVLPRSNVVISNKIIPFHILGDSAFALKDWLVKPYRQRAHPADHESAFNRKFSRARVVIEHAFGRLKGRWRRLMKDPFEVALKDVSVVILAAAILHNMCEQTGDEFYQDWFILNTNSINRSRAQDPAEHFRDTLAHYYLTS